MSNVKGRKVIENKVFYPALSVFVLVPNLRSGRILLTLNWIILSKNKIFCGVRGNRIFPYNNTTNWHNLVLSESLKKLRVWAFIVKPFTNTV